jgi:hypothetical protein
MTIFFSKVFYNVIIRIILKNLRDKDVHMKKKKKLGGVNNTASSIPSWSIGTWVYGGYYGSLNDDSFNQYLYLKSVLADITQFNTNSSTKSPINMIYAYGSDLELPWSGDSPNTSMDDPSNYSLFLDPIGSNMSVMVMNDQPQNIYKSIIIDGRIDNGYLMGFNDSSFSLADVDNLANLVLNGHAQIGSIQNGVTAYAPGNTLGVTINGIQIDIEPFNITNANQKEFYTKIAQGLSKSGQYFSVFTFPKDITSDLKATFGDVGYAVISLYDLKDDPSMSFATDPTQDPSATPVPVVISSDCSSATYDTTVPHSIPGYQAAAQYAVEQTIVNSKKSGGVKYKFAIPIAASAHEFESWSKYNCTYQPQGNGTQGANFLKTVSCSEGNLISLGLNKQSEYIQAGIAAIKEGIKNQTALGNFDPTLFVGIDLWGFSGKMTWSPVTPVVDWNEGTVGYGGAAINSNCYGIDPSATPSTFNPPYVVFEPGMPDLVDDFSLLSNLTKEFFTNPS